MMKMEIARKRTLALLDLVPDEFLTVRVHDFYSPVGWHFGHIGMTEEFWVRARALGQPPLNEHLSFLFANLPENPKDNRVNLPTREEIVKYLSWTRCTALEALDEADVDSPDRLIHDGYAWEFAFQHECQHQETITELLQLIRQHIDERHETAVEANSWDRAHPSEMIRVAGGTFMMGSDLPDGYDNEKHAHSVEVASFELDRTPVTSSQWLEFIRNGGYHKASNWSERGWEWRRQEDVTHPEFWTLSPEDRPGYFGPLGWRKIDPNEPITSISWFEADAYARWAGKRLPTEAEWEFAARFDPTTARTRHFPWGDEEPDQSRASFGLIRLAPDPVGSHVAGVSASGFQDMAGGVWEWTSSPFLPYAGFEAYPYEGYSKDHMDGNHFVCRGGSWATSASILRASFRNWYVPTYRQGFLGLRCAR